MTRTAVSSSCPLSERQRIGFHIAAILAVALLMMAPAIWNGYPLIYFDSEDYVDMSFTWQPIVFRIMTYGAFVGIARLFDSLWTVVIVQALMTSWMLHEAVSAFVGRWRGVVFLALGIVLALSTGLAVVASELMADLFAGLAILGLAVLAFGDALPRWRRLVLVPMVMISIAVHMSHVAVACGLAIVLVAMAVSARWLRPMPRPRLGLPLLAVALGTLAVPATHWAATGEAFFSRSGRVLQMALFVQDGLAKKYLDAVCPQGAQLKMCAHKDELPATADEFLWGDSPFDSMGGWKAMHDESDLIVKGTIRLFPLDVAKAMLDNTWTQLNLVADGEDLVPMTWHFVKTSLRRYPQESRHFRFARQQRRFGIDFEPVNRVHVPIAEAAEIAMLGLLVVAWRRRDRITAGLIVVVAMAFLGNAFVCGALSNPHDRYQNRIVWLALFSSVVGAVRLDQRIGARRPKEPFPDPLGRLRPVHGGKESEA
ncbi:MAG: hypothetical protein M0006_00990 [Magnetospirillum sp.]|nr:hypothetical protein [Magnetospirillum sp.]